MTPKTIGRGDAYQIVSTIGRGGFATVYKAYHAALDRYVAIKMLRPEILEPEGALHRFQIEARASARLAGHPNIVTVYDYGEEDGSPYLVLQLVDGVTLERRLADPLSAREAARIIDGVASALDFAHSHQLIHRDIKPSNVLLDDDGQVVLSDFGIAKLLDATSSLTVNLLGTPEYMSPEQIKGVDLDGRSDVYSLGIMAYRMFAGRPPFRGSPMALLHQHVSEPPPPMSQGDRAIPPGIDDIVMRALAKDREDRPNTAGQFAAELRQALRPSMLVEDAREALAAGNLNGADALLAEIRRQYPAHPDLPSIGQEIARQRALEDGRARVAAHLEAGRWQAALAELDRLGLRGATDSATEAVVRRAEAGLAEERRAEAQRRAEAERAERRAREERERQAEAQRQAEAERRAEAQRQAESARQAEVARLAEVARHAEDARRAEAERRADLERTMRSDAPPEGGRSERPTRQTPALSDSRLDATATVTPPPRVPAPPAALASTQALAPRPATVEDATGRATAGPSDGRRSRLWPIGAAAVGGLVIVAVLIMFVAPGVLGSSGPGRATPEATAPPATAPIIAKPAPTTAPAPTQPAPTPAPKPTTPPATQPAPTPAPKPTAPPATQPAPTAVPTAVPTVVPATPTAVPPTPEPVLAARVPWRDGVDMALVPAGAFVMGDDGDPSTAPRFTPTLPAFYLDLTEVTNARFATFVQQAGYQPKGDWHHYADGAQFNPTEFDVDRNDHPVVNVTWADASEYCQWAGKRLPSEAEWEKGARGTDGRRWPWGNDPHPEFANVETLNDADKEPDTARVGSLPQGASPFGLLDMTGNAREWTGSPLLPYPIDPAAPIPPDAATRVTRGASWLSLPNAIEIVRRLAEPPTTAAKDLGFRCAVSADQASGNR